jgi:periplasmic divalent cation tolerance protein
MAFISIYVTHPNLKTAKSITKSLMHERLIACANFFPIQSTYWWDGKIENTKEYVSILKTKTENWNKVKTAISKIHPYKTPCIIKMEVSANKEYETWINQESN